MSNNIYDILKKMQNLETPASNMLTESAKECKTCGMVKCKCESKKHESKKKDKVKEGSIAKAVAQVEQQLAEKFQGFKKISEDALDFLRSPEGIAKNRADQVRADQNFADRSAKHMGQQIGDQYHDQLMKNSPSYADEYRSRAKDMPYDKLDKLAKSLQAKHDPMGGPTNIDYEKIKKNPMATRAGEQGVDWRPFGPGPKDSFDSDKFGRPVREGEMEESGLQAYLGKKKYGKEGMQALQKAGRDGASKEKMAKIRARHDKMDEGNYNEDMLSGKEKSFAALAEPKDKITYADKIAGAKQGKKTEGNKFSGNLMKARAQGLKRADLDGDGNMEPVKEADGWDDKGNRQLGPDEANKVYAHSKYDPSRSANAQYSDHFDDAGNERLSHDRAVEVGKHPSYNPNLPANAQGHLLKKQGSTGSVQEADEPSDFMKGVKRFFKGKPSELDVREKHLAKAAFSNDPAAREKEFARMDKVQSVIDRADKRSMGAPGTPDHDPRLGADLDPKAMMQRSTMREGWEEMQKYLEKKRGPESKGDAGKKAGTRYGGSAQKDDDNEDLDGEGKPTVKKKGRPKGTGGGAKFNFKKPKD